MQPESPAIRDVERWMVKRGIPISSSFAVAAVTDASYREEFFEDVVGGGTPDVCKPSCLHGRSQPPAVIYGRNAG